MNNAKLLVICFLIFSLGWFESNGQDCVAGLKTEVKNASPGLSDGKVIFTLENKSEVSARYLIFEVTAVSDASGKRTAVENGQVDRLPAGKYEFLVIDRRNKKCFKEILVDVNE